MKLKWYLVKPWFDLYCFLACGAAGRIMVLDSLWLGLFLLVFAISASIYGIYLVDKEELKDLADHAREIFSK